MQEIRKPAELLSARESAERLFALLQTWFDVPHAVTLDLRTVDSAVAELGDPQLVMAMAMRKLQALHLLTTPGVRTTTDAVLTLIQDLERALASAPDLHLQRAVDATDWDQELVHLEQAGEGDDEVEVFRRDHQALHAAARAVLHLSEGKVCALV